MFASLPFIPGHTPARPGPLARFLPPVPEGVASNWLTSHLPRGAWVLDPFGASPRVAVEMAQAGYRVLVAANNPVARFLLEMAATPPSESELRAALAALAATFKGDDRLELHIQSLYLTECAQCGQHIPAEAFLWDRSASASASAGTASPYARIYHCQHCGDSGERPATSADAARAAHFASGGMHRARALERVAPLDDPDRAHVEEALSTYLPRAIYALFTIINKLESLPVHQRHLVTALLLSACDQANTLWPYPTQRARPRQLSIPTRFRENNIWLALEEALPEWTSQSPSNPATQLSGETAELDGKATLPRISLTVWPDIPPGEGGIAIFEGRLKELGEEINREIFSKIRVEAVIGVLPRPNQAYWALSALWAGWLWGRSAAAPFKSVLRRRRYDWGWHTTALQAAFGTLNPLLKPGVPVLALMGEAEPGFLSATMLAAGLSGLLEPLMAMRKEETQAQLLWQTGIPIEGAPPLSEVDQAQLLKELQVQIQDAAQAGGQAYLQARGEPADYLDLHAAALLALSNSAILPGAATLSPADVFNLVQNAFQQAFTFRSGFARYGGSEHSLEVGRWWLREKDSPPAKRGTRHNQEGKSESSTKTANRESISPLADRVEIALVNYLQQHRGCTLDELDQALCGEFQGLFTPNLELIMICLDSYGMHEPPGSGRWRLRPEDLPRARRADLAELENLLVQTGQYLGFVVASSSEAVPPHVEWREENGAPGYVFVLSASAILGKIILPAIRQNLEGRRSILVYPGGRAGLIAYKLRNDPRASQALADWTLVKFRHLRQLAESQRLSRDNLEAQLVLDPLTNNDLQIPLL